MNYPKGKGLFVWQIKSLPDDFDIQCLELDLNWVAVKVANGTGDYNLRLTWRGWVDDILSPWIKKMRAVGVTVYGWQYVYGYQPRGEAEKAIERIKKFDLDGFLVDAEKEYRDTQNRVGADTYMRLLRSALPDLPIGLTSYRYPKVHWGLPWAEFLSRCDFHTPQVYWNAPYQPRGFGPVPELRRSIGELREIADLPFVPAGRAYGGEGFPVPEPKELTDFMRECRDQDLPGCTFWSADHIFNKTYGAGLRNAIADFDWPVEDDPEEPGELTLEQRVEKLERAVFGVT